MSFLKAPAVFLAPVLLITGCGGEPKLTYVTDVEPIFKTHCVECHLASGDGFKASGFGMGNYDDVMKGTKFGPVINPGSAISSTLYLLISGKADPSIRMPHGKSPLPEKDIETIQKWIDQGAQRE